MENKALLAPLLLGQLVLLLLLINNSLTARYSLRLNSLSRYGCLFAYPLPLLLAIHNGFETLDYEYK